MSDSTKLEKDQIFKIARDCLFMALEKVQPSETDYIDEAYRVIHAMIIQLTSVLIEANKTNQGEKKEEVLTEIGEYLMDFFESVNRSISDNFGINCT